MVGPLSASSLPALLPRAFPLQDNVLTPGAAFLSLFHTTFTEPFPLHHAFPSPVARGQHSCRHSSAQQLHMAHALLVLPHVPSRQHLHAALLHTRLTKKPSILFCSFFPAKPLAEGFRPGSPAAARAVLVCTVSAEQGSLPSHPTKQPKPHSLNGDFPSGFVVFFFFFNIFLLNAYTCQLLFSCQLAHEGGLVGKHKSQPQRSTPCLAGILSLASSSAGPMQADVGTAGSNPCRTVQRSPPACC